jgi:ssDNA-binding Zn-finger/Zn-ribbon topoisomerase 1
VPPGIKEELAARARALAGDDPVCPQCKSRMVLRIAQRGPEDGAKFWGCSNYPKCKCTVKLEKK